MFTPTVNINAINAGFSFSTTQAKLTSEGGSPVGVDNLQLDTTHGTFEMKTTMPRMRQDSVAFFRALKQDGFTGNYSEYTAKLGQENYDKWVSEIIDMGKQLGELHLGISPGQVIAQRMVAESVPNMQLDFLPKVKADVWVEIGGVEKHYNVGTVKKTYRPEPANNYHYTPATYSGSVQNIPRVQYDYTPQRSLGTA